MFTDFYYFEDSAGEFQDIGVSEYHIPSYVREHVDYITPGIRLRPAKKRDVTKRNLNQKRAAFGLAEGKTVYHKSKPINALPKKFGPNASNDLPGVNSTTCSEFITADCTRGRFS